MAWAILSHSALPSGGFFIARLSLLFLDLRGWQRHAKDCRVSLPVQFWLISWYCFINFVCDCQLNIYHVAFHKNSLTKSSILDVQLCSKYTSEFKCKQSIFWWGINIPNMHDKSTKNQSVSEWYRCSKCEPMDKNVECLYSPKVAAVEYFKLLSMRYRKSNALTQRV